MSDLGPIATNEDTINQSKRDYIHLTHQLNNYNEIYNLNKYLDKVQNVEMNTLDTMGNRVKSQSLKLRQEYMLKEFGVNEYIMRNNLMYFTLIVVCVIVAICSLIAKQNIKTQTGILIIGGLSLVWAFIMYAVIKINSNRRKYAWNQFYWMSMDKRGSNA